MASVDDIRTELISLFESSNIMITESANLTGRGWFKQIHRYPTQYHIFDHILDLLHSGCPLRAVEMGIPAGSGGIAYSLVDHTSKDLYIKVKIEEGFVKVISFHKSKHAPE